MTEAQLLAKLATKYWQVKTPVKAKAISGIDIWRVETLSKDADSVWHNSIPYWKISSSECYWYNNEPLPGRGFIQSVKGYIKDKISDGTIEGAFIEDVDSSNEIVRVRVITDSLEEKNFLIDKDASGDLQHRLITTGTATTI